MGYKGGEIIEVSKDQSLTIGLPVRATIHYFTFYQHLKCEVHVTVIVHMHHRKEFFKMFRPHISIP